MKLHSYRITDMATGEFFYVTHYTPCLAAKRWATRHTPALCKVVLERVVSSTSFDYQGTYLVSVRPSRRHTHLIAHVNRLPD